MHNQSTNTTTDLGIELIKLIVSFSFSLMGENMGTTSKSVSQSVSQYRT